MEKNDIILVLDAGNDGPTIGPEVFCCALTFTFFRGI